MLDSSAPSSVDSIQASWTVDDQILSQGIYWHWYKVPWQGYVCPAAGVCFGAFALWAINHGGARSATCWVLLTMSIYLILRYWVVAFRYRQRARNAPGYGLAIKWVFNEEGFQVTSGDSEFKTLWGDRFETFITPDGFLLYPQKGVFIWIPQSGFASTSDLEGFADILQRKTECRQLT